jgi:acyl-coenzyme A thioesterase PaaI-like protein
VAQDPAREEFVLPSNVCFGCGEGNSHGLQVSIYRDPNAPNRLLGEFLPRPDIIGLPGITHGGAIYTAMDCMATWSGMVLKQTKAMWVLRSAATTYHRPAIEGAPISLSASLEKEGDDWEAIEVRVEARNDEEQLLAEGLFKVIPLPPDKFKALADMDELPAGWSDWFEGRAQLIDRSVVER